MTEFFQAFGSTMSVEQFDPVSFISNEDEAHTVVKLKATRTANGRSADMNLHHFFRFRDGKTAFYRGSEDTCQAESLFSD